MKNRLLILICAAAIPFSGYAATTEAGLAAKAERAAQVLDEVTKISDNTIPLSLLERAVCIAVLPDVIRGGFVFGARIGQGVVSCRVANGWSQPSYVRIVGGNWGLQIGIASIDMVLVFVNQNALERLSVNNFTLGGDATIAVGPIGREAKANTDYQLKSEVYSYSRSRGLFGGLTIEGASLSIDHDSNAKMYDNKSTPRSLLTTDGSYAPSSLRTYVRSLDANAP
ncbi:MAG: lipid-binding SYLF domain-containing protein [Bdellovibrionaceae bacterium]|nr:lipid-binding SYLF domain-containing protein [Pseudobdellovibrionaceae bacterium]